MRPVGSQRSMTAASGTSSIRPAAAQSTIVRSAGLPIASTIAAASAIVLITGVSVVASGSMQYTTPARCASSATRANESCARAIAVSRVSPAGIARCPGEPCTSTLPPTSAQKSTSRRMTSTVRARTASSGLVIDRPLGVSRSQCSPVIATPASAAARRIAARSWAIIRCGSSDSVKGATSSPS